MKKIFVWVFIFLSLRCTVPKMDFNIIEHRIKSLSESTFDFKFNVSGDTINIDLLFEDEEKISQQKINLTDEMVLYQFKGKLINNFCVLITNKTKEDSLINAISSGYKDIENVFRINQDSILVKYKEHIIRNFSAKDIEFLSSNIRVLYSELNIKEIPPTFIGLVCLYRNECKLNEGNSYENRLKQIQQLSEMMSKEKVHWKNNFNSKNIDFFYKYCR